MGTPRPRGHNQAVKHSGVLSKGRTGVARMRYACLRLAMENGTLVPGRPWPLVNCSSAVVTETPRSLLSDVAHNLKLAANIDHMRDGTANVPSEPRPPPIVSEHRGDGFIRQRRFPV